MAWTLTNLRTSVDHSADATDVAIAQRAYAETSRMTATISNESGSPNFLNEDEVVIMDGALKAFQGYVRILDRGDRGVSTQMQSDIDCQDYTTALGDDVCDPVSANPVRLVVESDKTRIAWLGTTYGTRGIVFSGATIVQLRASMPEQDFTNKNLHEALTMICAITGGSFYVDYDKVLHYFSSEVISAPFGLSDNPNGSTTFGYEGLRLRDDTVAFCNAVLVTNDGNINRWRPSDATVASLRAAGTLRAIVLHNSEIATFTDADAAGDALLAQYGVSRQPSQLTTYRPGLRAGMTVQLTHAGYGLSAATYRISSIEAKPLSKDRIAYTVFFGSGSPISLQSLISRADQTTANLVASVGAAQSAADAVSDLSVGGGNIIPNSSFEDGTSWVPGTSWVVGFDPVSPQEAFQGTDVARWTPSATQGTLQTPLLPVARSDSYFFSAWVFCRAFTSGRLRMLVEEYNAANTLLATTQVGSDITAVSTEWQRLSRKFAPAAGVGVTGWQTTTAKIRVVFGPQALNTTGTFDVDGVQGERGGMLTAYAPAPYEITAASIGTTQIADDAITTPKVAAAQIIGAKIAAGTITGGLIAANTINTDRLAVGGTGTIQIDGNGIYISDPNGAQAVLVAQGFSGPWDDYLQSRVYNNTWAFGTLGTLANGSTILPYWTVAKVGSTGWTTAYESSAGTTGNGRRIRVTATTGGNLTDELTLTQFVPVDFDFPRQPARRFAVELNYYGITQSPNGKIELRLQCYKSDKTTALGSEVVVTDDANSIQEQEIWAEVEIDPLTAYVRVRARVYRTTAVSAFELYLFGIAGELSRSRLVLSGDSGTGTTEIYTPVADGLSIAVRDTTAPTGARGADGFPMWVIRATEIQFPDTASHLRNTVTNRIETIDADIRAAGGLLITRANAGSPSDAVFSGTPINGGFVVDTTNSRIWARTGTATWKFVAIAGERIPGDERRCPECLVPIDVDTEVVAIANRDYSGDDVEPRALHLLWKHRDCGFGWRLLKRLGLVRSRVAWYTDLIESEAALRIALDDRLSSEAPELQVLDGGRATG